MMGPPPAARTQPPPPAEPPPQVRTVTPVLGDFTAVDALREEPLPVEAAQGKSKAFSLMQPQEFAVRLLPAETVEKLFEYSRKGCHADCGAPWPEEVIRQARAVGPHKCALTSAGTELIWDDVQYQADAGFVQIVTEDELFGGTIPPELKISRVAAIPQPNRRDRLILNLSAPVEMLHARSRRGKKRKRVHPSVNETTQDAEDQAAVKELGTALPSLLLFMFETDCTWEIDWQKIDLSDGFWRMVVEEGKEYNFVYQLPRRPDDAQDHFVVPSALQMGWKNSPAYFCMATEAGRQLIQRTLALTMETGIDQPHRHDAYCLPEGAPIATDWVTPEDVTMVNRVYMDDYINGVAGPVGRPRKREVLRWVSRGSLHSIHAIFPPPDVIGHKGGRDSVSVKKAERGDVRFKPEEVLLGAELKGQPGASRTVRLPEAKVTKYVQSVQAALDQPRHYIGRNQFEKLHGRIQYAGQTMPHLRGFMTPLNRQLRQPSTTVGLAAKSDVREALQALIPHMEIAHEAPAHITELVPPDLPHVYGTVDAAAGGMGGTWLPCTKGMQPLVWRVPFPSDIAKMVQAQGNNCTNSDVEAIAAFVAECMLDAVFRGMIAGLSSHLDSDSSNTASWLEKQSSKALSRIPERMLRLLALRHRWDRRGPFDITHWPGKTNLMADFASRSYDQGFDHSPAGDQAFFNKFVSSFPLPPQLGSWRFVRPSNEIILLAFSILRGPVVSPTHPLTVIGKDGPGLPTLLAMTRSSFAFKDPSTTWNESSCSWPLLEPSGVENTSLMDARLRGRRSRRRFDSARSAWSTLDLTTLAKDISPKDARN